MTEMEERLNTVLRYVNEWLRFAEAKNAALLTLSAGLVFTLIRNMPESGRGNWEWAYITAGILFFVCAICCLISFIPQIKIPWLSSQRKPSSDDNLCFYGHISAYSPENLLKELSDGVENRQERPNRIEMDLAGQAVINSRIAVRKFGLFTFAVWLALIAAGFLALGGFLWL